MNIFTFFRFVKTNFQEIKNRACVKEKKKIKYTFNKSKKKKKKNITQLLYLFAR